MTARATAPVKSPWPAGHAPGARGHGRYGAALKNGLRNAKHDYILIADADALSAGDIPRLLAQADKYAMVVRRRTGPSCRCRRCASRANGSSPAPGVPHNRKIPDLNFRLRVFRKGRRHAVLPALPEGFRSPHRSPGDDDEPLRKFIPINYHRRVGKSSIKPLRDFKISPILIIRICATSSH